MKYTPLILVFFFSPAFGEVCSKPLKSGSEAYQCIFLGHPEIKALSVRSEELRAREAVAKQLPNPEIEAATQLSGESGYQIELLQPVDISGRRSAQIHKARAENSLLLLKDQGRRLEISTSILETLLRFRQIKSELQILNESVVTLSRIISQLRARPALPPEQATSLRLFSLYLNTLEFKKARLESEEEQFSRQLASILGRSLAKEDQPGLVPFQKWPALKSVAPVRLLAVRTLAMEVSSNEADLKVARSESWPDLKVGPTVDKFSAADALSVGMKVGLTLPVWNANGAARDLARARLSSSRLLLEAETKRAEADLDALVVRYQKATAVLDKSPSVNIVSRTIKDIEARFKRGLIPPSSVIETYRSSLELIEEIHQNEIFAMVTWATFQFLTEDKPLELP